MSVQDPEQSRPPVPGAPAVPEPVVPAQPGPPQVAPPQALPRTAVGGRSASHVGERLLVVLTALIAAVLAVPSLVTAARDGSVDLATVFYPVLLVAIATLAWGRRSGA